jgi:hypothetical protein
MSYRAPVILSILSATLICATCLLRAQKRTSGHAPLSACAVTLPNGSEPPGVFTPHGPNDNPGSKSYLSGNGKLWTTLGPNGTVEFRTGGPGFAESDGARSMKWPWWRGTRGKLTIEGKRWMGPRHLYAQASPTATVIQDFNRLHSYFPLQGVGK